MKHLKVLNLEECNPEYNTSIIAFYSAVIENKQPIEALLRNQRVGKNAAQNSNEQKFVYLHRSLRYCCGYSKKLPTIGIF